MKSNVADVQLQERRKLSYGEGALLAVVLVIATKFCTLPSVLAGAAGSKALWVAATLTAAELCAVFFAVKTARAGGVPSLPLPRGVKVGIYAFFALFFTLKLAAFARELSTYYALSLFENVPVLPIMVLLLFACALLARKGYTAMGRMMEVFAWLFAFVFLFAIIFTRTEGDLFNALGMFSPDFSGFGKGLLGGLAWYGDAAAICFFDLRGKEGVTDPSANKKTKFKIAFAAASFSFLMIALFFAVFTASYGDAAKMTDYAFIKLSAFKANTDELGSADWPVIILWSVVTTLYLTVVLISAKESLLGATQKEGSKSLLPYFVLGGAALLFSAGFLDEEGDYQSYMTKVASVLSLLAIGATAGLGIYSLAKGTNHEKQN